MTFHRCLSHQHQTRWSRRRGVLRADPHDTTTTNETAGADARAAAATTDTDRAALLMIATADDQRVLESEFILSDRLTLLTVVVLQCFLTREKENNIYFGRSRRRMYGRGRSRSREDDRYDLSLTLFRGRRLLLSPCLSSGNVWPELNHISKQKHSNIWHRDSYGQCWEV